MRREDGRDTAYFQNGLLPGCVPSVIFVTAHSLLGGKYVGVDKDGAYTVKLSVLLSDVHSHVHIPYSEVQLPHTFHYNPFERKTKQAVFANTVVSAVAKVCVMRVCVSWSLNICALCREHSGALRITLPSTHMPAVPPPPWFCLCICLSLYLCPKQSRHPLAETRASFTLASVCFA